MPQERGRGWGSHQGRGGAVGALLGQLVGSEGCGVVRLFQWVRLLRRGAFRCGGLLRAISSYVMRYKKLAQVGVCKKTSPAGEDTSTPP